MKNVKEILLLLLTAGCVAGCVMSYGIWQEQKAALAKMDNELDRKQGSIKEIDTEDGIEWYRWGIDPDAGNRIVKESAKLDSLEEETGSLQMKYDLQRFIEKQGNRKESSEKVWQKYFHIRQGELARIEGIEDLADCETFGFLNNPFSGVIFDLYDGITLQYTNGTTSRIEEYSLPIAVIITGAESDLGFMDARAGMNFRQIMQNAYEEEIKQGFMTFNGDWVYYIQYRDDLFQYSFISEDKDGRESKLIVTQLSQEIPQMGWISEESVPQSTSYAYWMAAAEFEDIEKEHEILAYDISTSPQYDYENTPFRDEIDELKWENDQIVKERGSEYEMKVDYHVFDFNNDGIEDYVLCIDGILYSGSAGHSVEIYVGMEDGGVRKVLGQTLRYHNSNMPSGHERFTVLNEKTDGFYAIVIPGGTNRILRYDPETDCYEFQETE